MIIHSLEQAYQGALKKNWDTLYICVDLHSTVVKSNYDINILPTEWIASSKKCLQYLSSRQDVVLIMYTCSHLKEIVKYLEFFKENSIDFKYVNRNPEVPDNALGRYVDKMYFSILFEDKAGFYAETDWDIVYDFFINKPILK